jgi:hypothetical protein
MVELAILLLQLLGWCFLTRLYLGVSHFYMSFFLLNKTFDEKIEKHKRIFFCNVKDKKGKYYLLESRMICRSKNKGGMGVLRI